LTDIFAGISRTFDSKDVRNHLITQSIDGKQLQDLPKTQERQQAQELLLGI